MKLDYMGMEFLKIAAFLFAARYVAAALFMGPGLKNWDSSLFEASYRYVGNELTVLAGVCAVLGVAFLIRASGKSAS
ncbi:hypothetical protein [Armatimonas rosea]|uniref:DUF3784 domain-containing protein n=1 Tax=Armatimonas rosea TaxID=685828 RepID=A0A7W9W532_ARMRO|nr:hypothetical protein [Armatimonas rosea]MBB6049158.1 hypothetical protein [Armatimonas rosea]